MRFLTHVSAYLSSNASIKYLNHVFPIILKIGLHPIDHVCPESVRARYRRPGTAQELNNVHVFQAVG
jgi:hypothetical protein